MSHVCCVVFIYVVIIVHRSVCSVAHSGRSFSMFLRLRAKYGFSDANNIKQDGGASSYHAKNAPKSCIALYSVVYICMRSACDAAMSDRDSPATSSQGNVTINQCNHPIMTVRRSICLAAIKQTPDSQLDTQLSNIISQREEQDICILPAQQHTSSGQRSSYCHVLLL